MTFQATRWSLVLAAGASPGEDQRVALETLCSAYWYPLYAYARRRGHRAPDAEDLTQGFFAELLEKRWVDAANPERGRFRGFLLTAFRRYAGHAREKDNAKKRGGDVARLSLDFEEGERRYAFEPTHDLTAERLYERRWALTLLERVLDSLRDEMTGVGQGAQFTALRGFLPGGTDERTYAEVAEAIGTTEGGVKVAVHRLRQRYRIELRAAVAETTAEPGAVDAEIQALLAALAR